MIVFLYLSQNAVSIQRELRQNVSDPRYVGSTLDRLFLAATFVQWVINGHQQSACGVVLIAAGSHEWSHHQADFHAVAQEFIAGETLHGLAKRYDVSRTLIRIWVKKLTSDRYRIGVPRRTSKGPDSDVAKSRSVAPVLDGCQPQPSSHLSENGRCVAHGDPRISKLRLRRGTSDNRGTFFSV